MVKTLIELLEILPQKYYNIDFHVFKTHTIQEVMK